MPKHTFIDCNGLAGFMSYGFVKSGLEMIARTGTLDFGAPVVEANRARFGGSWEGSFADDVEEWPRRKADAVVGCPPCSGWSVWSSVHQRGPDSAAHEHTRAFMRYAGAIKPQAIVFECVQQAYSDGREVMLKYRDMVEDISGKKYDLHHVMHNNLQLGGFSYRPRYFWVAVRRGMKFGAAVSEPAKFPTVMDIIGDLENLPLQWSPQKIKDKPSSFVKALRSKNSTVDGHIGVSDGSKAKVEDIFAIIGNGGWKPNEIQQEALKAAVRLNNNKFPQSWLGSEKNIRRRKFVLGYSQPGRWDGEGVCRVLTGAALQHVVHPTQPRLITHREAARIQGLPDDWNIEETQDYSMMKATWGKAVAVQAGEWIGKHVAACLDGEQSGPAGEKIGDHEYMHHTDKGFSRVYVKRKMAGEKK